MISDTLLQLCGHVIRFSSPARLLLQVVGKEEQLQYYENDEQFHRNDEPESLPQRHVAKSIIVQVERPIPETCFPHRR